jgi:hypothetical protein
MNFDYYFNVIGEYVFKNGIYDVDGSVFLIRPIDKIPFKFGKVTSLFSCSNNYLTSLENCPSWVGYDFNCIGNKLSSLKGCPEYIGHNFYCQGNKYLKKLDFLPNYINNKLYCDESLKNSKEYRQYRILNKLKKT